MSVEIETAGLTDMGRERERNEDQFLIATMQRTLAVEESSLVPDPQCWLPKATEGTVLLVADGMGGADSGDVASSVAVRSIVEYVCQVMPLAHAAARAHTRRPLSTLPGVREGLQSALAEGDAEVKRAAKVAGEHVVMGTTLTMAYLLWPYLYVAHAGDSRCYVLTGEELGQVTTDHTLAEQLRQQSDLELSPDSPWHHVLWNALGGRQATSVEPEVRRVVLQPDDTILLCSDGLTKHLDDEEIRRALLDAPSSADACRSLVDQANDDGGGDNITVIVARCVDTAAQTQVHSAAPTAVRRPR